MNFNKWFQRFSVKTNGGYSNSDYEFIAEESWNACKKEVLNLIKNTDIAQRNAYLVLLELKQKIKNL